MYTSIRIVNEMFVQCPYNVQSFVYSRTIVATQNTLIERTPILIIF